MYIITEGIYDSNNIFTCHHENWKHRLKISE
jgi:hypothetical protein